LNDFFVKNADKIKASRAAKREAKKAWDVLNDARAVARQTKDPEITKALEDKSDGTIALSELESIIVKIKKKHGL